jgi:hypothetical protein
LRRQVPASLAFQAIWAESIHDKVGEEGEEKFEKLAEKVNECLGDDDTIKEDKQADLGQALQEYEGALAESVGAERARIDMLMKAVPAVADRLRAASGEQAEAETPPKKDADTSE